MALRAYSSPGVVVTETVNPSLAPLLANPSVVAIVAEARGLQSASERLILEGVVEQTLRYTGVDDASVVVQNASTGVVLDPGTYVITAGADPDAAVTGDEPYGIKRFEDPDNTVLVAATGTGALTGTYKYAVTFVNAEGETGIGQSTSAAVAIAAAGFNLTVISAGPTGTTARNIYRMKTLGTGADNIWHLVATIADNVTTTLTNEATTDVTASTGAEPPTSLASGDTVVVAYDYTDDLYYEPTMFADFDDIVDKYGDPFDADGLIDSGLSFAARLALINGASEVMCVATAGSAAADYDAALEQLEDETSVRILVVGDGSSQVLASVTSHVTSMNAIGLYRQAIVGRDGSATAVTAATLRTAASATNNEAVQFVSPASFQMQNPVTGRTLNVGGQWAAAAIAGMYAGRDVQIPLTRKSVAGFSAINDKRTATELALDSAAGLAVIEDRGGVLRVRHSVTTNVGSVNSREASVVRAKYDMAHRLREVLDSSLVGTVIDATRAPLVAQALVTGVLEQLTVEQAIGGYSDVKGRIKSGDPTTIEVKFAYQPAYPINNVAVSFVINTQTGEFALAA